MKLPRLRPDQSAIAIHPAKVKVIACGRRYGKSLMAGSVALAAAYNGGFVAWVVPTYKNARPLWRFIEQHATSYGDLRRAEMSVQFDSGGHVTVYTADNDIAIRGEAFDLVVVDEAAQIKEETYSDVIIPTLADRDGRVMLISTPKGMNWFHREWIEGREKMNAEIAAWHAPTSDNPSINIRAAFERIKARVAQGVYPLRSFQQEWLAEFVADGSYFQNIEACCVIEHPDAPADHPGHTFGLGIDWGQSSDFTVGTIGCRECDRTVDWFRFNGLSYHTQRKRIVDYCKKWPGVRVLPERNSIGEPNIDDLRREVWKDDKGNEQNVEVELGPDRKYGFYTGPSTKPMLIEQLYLALQRGRKYPKEYADEFRAYEVITRANGAPSFSAPSGAHDDRVISAALENYLSLSALQVF